MVFRWTRQSGCRFVVGQQQRVEIMRCLLQDPSLLIMDEPTSVLTPQETDQLFDVLRRLAETGCAVLFISHKLDEIKQLTSRATILRGGKKVAEVDTAEKTTHQMAELMVGTSVEAVKTGAGLSSGDVLFSVRALSRPAYGPFEVALDEVNLTAHAGEVLGIAGIAGNGQDELMAALSGEWRGQHSGLSGRNRQISASLARITAASIRFVLFLKNGTVMLRSRR